MLFQKKHKIGDTIAKLRKEKGWTQNELADKLQVSDKAISKWESLCKKFPFYRACSRLVLNCHCVNFEPLSPFIKPSVKPTCFLFKI